MNYQTPLLLLETSLSLLLFMQLSQFGIVQCIIKVFLLQVKVPDQILRCKELKILKFLGYP